MADNPTGTREMPQTGSMSGLELKSLVQRQNRVAGKSPQML
jgi:hypothetical protein